MKKCVAVAFLQNMWVRDPDRVRLLIARHGDEYRTRFMHMALFSGCLTGRRLKTAFGDDLLRTIHFEEASREIAGDSKTICPPDHTHIRKTLDQFNPKVVLAFGKIAHDAVVQHWNGALIKAPHPAARHPDTVSRLRAAALEYAELVKSSAALG